jgi:hypothetical protein
MIKYFAVLTLSLTVLIFIGGCTPAVPQSTEPSKAEPPQADTTQPEILQAELPQTEATETEIPQAQSPKTESAVAEIPQTEPAPTESTAEILFHDKCAPLLSEFVHESGIVKYKDLKRNRIVLKNLLDEFDNLDPNEYNRWPKEDKIAFWLNAYNIQMLRIITDNYPIESSRWLRVIWPPTSIRHIPPVGVIGAAKWDSYKFIVMDEEFTLSDIENRFFRGQFDEPRVFFALSQASLSGPPLRNEPYYGRRLYDQLDDQVKKFLSDEKNFRIDKEGRTVYLSAIFDPDWYGKGFIGKYGTDKKFKDQQPVIRAILNFICNYIPERDISFLETANYSVRYITYDWRLNE